MNQIHLSPVVKNIIIINVLIFLANQVVPINWDMFCLHYPRNAAFLPIQFITSIFMHGSIPHLAMNMIALASFGTLLEMVWGARRFFIFYLICGVGANLLHTLWAFSQWQFMQNDITGYSALGASGAIYGLLIAVALDNPYKMFQIMFFPFPMQARYMVALWAGIDLLGLFGNFNGDNVGHAAHLGGLIVGFLTMMYWRKWGSSF